MIVPSAVRSLEYVSFMVSIISNTTLVVLIFTKKTIIAGSYRHLMCSFCCSSIFYTTIDVIYQPIIHVNPQGYVVISSSILRKYQQLSTILCAFYASSYVNTMFLLCIHFVYRYFVVCKPKHLYIFHKKYFSRWIIFILVFYASWCANALFYLAEDDEYKQVIRKDIELLYSEDIFNLTYLGPFFYSKNGTTMVPHWKPITGYIQLMITQLITMSIIIYCGWQTYNKIKRNFTCSNAIEVQHRLLSMLITQTVCPTVFLYLPVIFLATTPLLDLNESHQYYLAILGYCTSIALAIYPAIEPIIVIYFIEDYRNCIVDYVGRFFTRKVEVPQQPTTTIDLREFLSNA